MAETTIVGHDICPICNRQTDISFVKSWPFPEEEKSKTEEFCPKCQYTIRLDSDSSNAEVAQAESFSRDGRDEKIRMIVSKLEAVEEYSDLDGEEVGEAIRRLPLSTIVLVYRELARHEKELSTTDPTATGFKKGFERIRARIKEVRS